MKDYDEECAFQETNETFGGLSKREYFIAKAMQGLCANPNFDDSSETYIASRAITIANRTLACIGD